ncbi:MAG: aldehyde ferredoxin oxidoreductase N-terminal domain-containing protein, partial [Syntrophaceae bacterium]
MGGWTGKVLRVDLSTGVITKESTDKYKGFLGGTGLAYKVFWDEVPPGTKSFDPENRIVFGVGPLTGTGAPLSGRVSVTSLFPISPLDLPSTGHMGGHWGPELKYAGYDSLIIQGASAAPVWLYIKDDVVEIRDASR